MIRRSLALFAVAAIGLGCSGAPADQEQEHLGSEESALTPAAATTAPTFDSMLNADPNDDKIGNFAGYRVILATVDANTGAVTGTRVRNHAAFSGSLTSATLFRQANVARYYPGDPCRAAAVAYNAGVTTGGVLGGGDGTGGTATGPFGRATGLASLGCKARLVVDLTTLNIRAFRPVP